MSLAAIAVSDMAEKLRAAGVNAKAIIIPGVGHGSGDWLEKWSQQVDQAAAFFDEQLKLGNEPPRSQSPPRQEELDQLLIVSEAATVHVQLSSTSSPSFV